MEKASFLERGEGRILLDEVQKEEKIIRQTISSPILRRREPRDWISPLEGDVDQVEDS